MAILSVANPTLADWAKSLDPNGSVAKVVELLSQTNEILQDCVYKEGNLPTGEKTTVRTSLPTVEWRELNKGVMPSKSTRAEILETCGILEARSEIDKEVADLNGNTAPYRLSEDAAFLEAMNITQAQTMFYGNPEANIKEYLGLANRYNSLSGGNKANIYDCEGKDDNNHSIYMVVWGERTVHGIFPKGSKAGLKHQDLGEQTVYLPDGRRYQAYVSYYQWKNGLVIKDWRYVVRICNIDIDDLNNQTVSQGKNASTSIIRQMNNALYRIPSMGMGRACFYMNRNIHAGLAALAMEKASNVLAIEKGFNQFGSPMSWVSFQGIPLRRVDALDAIETNLV